LKRLSFQLLGGFGIRDAQGEEIRLASRKGRALLAFLAVRAGESQGRDRLATLLWEEADEELARSSLRQALAAIRKALPAETHDVLIADSDSLQIAIDMIESDLGALHRALHIGTRAAYQQALNLHRGELLEGLDARSGAFEEWLTHERLVLRKQIVDIAQKLSTLCLAQDDLDGALLACTRWVALEPLNEQVHRTLMELHARRNAYSEALRQYQTCRDHLRRELDVAPEPATEQLYRDLLKRRRAATQTASGNLEPLAEEGSTSSDVSRRKELRDAIVLVARLEGLLELEFSLDPEDFHVLCGELQQRVQQTIATYGGRCDRRVGANVLAVFGVPQARGNEMECAVRAALALQTEFARTAHHFDKPLHLRVGIAQGQVLHDGELFPLTGRPTHTAHALAATAPDRGIALSDESRRALGERVVVHALDTTEGAHSGGWVLDSLHSDAALSTQPFVGRRPELAMLQTTLDRCVSSRRGRTLVVRGEAGIGKTRLVSALRASARAANVEVHTTGALDFGQSLGRRPVTALALSLLQLAPDASPHERAAALARAVAPSAVDQIIFLSDLIEAPLNEELGALEKAMEPAIRQRGRSLALGHLLENAARRSPLLIVIEDVHWADQDELARFAEVAAAIAQCPALLLMTTRPQDDPINAMWRARARGCPVTLIDLAPLASDEAQELADHYPQLASDLTHACIQRSEGNPLFLDQLLRAAAAGHDSLPGSIRSLVLARAERLESIDRDALQVAAVLGHRCDLQALRDVLGTPDYRPEVLERAALARAELSEICFAHALFRDAIYESILRSRRRELHTRAAQWFARGDLALRAEHLAAAGDEGAALAYLEAARAEQKDLRFERALALGNKGATIARDPRQLHQLSCLLGELHLVLGRTHDALTAYREAIDFASERRDQVEAWIGIASALRIMDRHPEALEALDHAKKAMGDSEDHSTLARIATLYGNLCFPLGRIDACLHAHEQALEHALLARSPTDVARAYSGIGDAWYQRGRIQTARDYFVRCIEEARRHQLPRVQLANLPMVGITQIYCCELDLADEHLRLAFQLAHRVSDARSELIVQLVQGTLLLYRGQFSDCERQSRRSCETAKQLGARRFHAEALSLIAAAVLARGEICEARALVLEALDLVRPGSMNYCGPTLLGVYARTGIDDSERTKVLHEGEALLAAGCVSHAYFEFYFNAIELSLDQQRWSEVERYADALAHYTREESVPWADMIIERGRLLAKIGAGDHSSTTIDRLRQFHKRSTERGLGLALSAVEAVLARHA
jgi:DNA-binding SARP family transcriptional activator